MKIHSDMPWWVKELDAEMMRQLLLKDKPKKRNPALSSE